MKIKVKLKRRFISCSRDYDEAAKIARNLFGAIDSKKALKDMPYYRNNSRGNEFFRSALNSSGLFAYGPVASFLHIAMQDNPKNLMLNIYTDNNGRFHCVVSEGLVVVMDPAQHIRSNEGRDLRKDKLLQPAYTYKASEKIIRVRLVTRYTYQDLKNLVRENGGAKSLKAIASDLNKPPVYFATKILLGALRQPKGYDISNIYKSMGNVGLCHGHSAKFLHDEFKRQDPKLREFKICILGSPNEDYTVHSIILDENNKKVFDRDDDEELLRTTTINQSTKFLYASLIDIKSKGIELKNPMSLRVLGIFKVGDLIDSVSS